MTSPVEQHQPTVRRGSHGASTGKPAPLEAISHASASRIGPGVAPQGVALIAVGDLSPEEASKRMAAYAAVDGHVKDHHKVLGIGSGSTVPYVVERLCQPPHCFDNEDRWFIPTGFQSKELIVKAGLNLGDVDQFPTIDVTIDGADEVDDDLNAIKGGGACQLREKVLAEAAASFIIVADSRKDSKVLGTNWKQGVPIEVAPFAWAKVFQNLQKMGCEKPVLRMGKMKAGPVVTDNGNFVIDAVYSEAYMRDPSELLNRIKMLTGVLEVGIFAGMAQAAYFGYPDGTVHVRWQDGPHPPMIDLTILSLESLVRDPQVILASFCVGLVSLLLAIWPRKAANLPPGPTPTFFVGNRNQVPGEKPWRWFRDLNLQYGPVVYLQMGQTPTIVLGTAQAAWDLLEKKSSIYSSRPRFIMGQMQKASDTYRPIQSLESKQLMQELVTRPSNWRVDLERYAASVIVTVTYGRRVHDVFADEVVAENRRSTEVLTSVNIPGKYLVESIPAMLWLPRFLTPWRNLALEQRDRDIGYYTRLVREVKERMAAGGAPFSFCVDTSSGTLMCFMLACAEFGPSFIPKAQAEIDAVVGPDRLPTFDDLPDLPEPRMLDLNSVYQGMFIPKGSTIIANLWSIHLNPDDFPDPHRFDPERFMVKRDYPGQWGHSAFGFGRRICPGMHLASNSIFINIARILWGFNLSKALDADGKEIPVDIMAFTNGFNSMPETFDISITPRSPAHVAVIAKENEAAQEELKQTVTLRRTSDYMQIAWIDTHRQTIMSARFTQTAARTARTHVSSTRSIRPRHLSTHQPSPSAPQSAGGSHIVSGMVGGGIMLGAIYGYYHYSGTAKVVSTARSTIDAATSAKDKALANTPSAKDALHLFKSLAGPTVAAFPGGAALLDATVGQLEGLLDTHGDEVAKILKKTAADVQTAIGDPKESGEKVLKVVEETMTSIAKLAQGQLDKVLEKNPEWKEAVGGGMEQLQKLSESHGPEARKIATSTYSEASKLVSKGGLNAETLEAVQKLIKEKSAAISKLAQETGSDAWSAAAEAAGPALKKMPDIQKLVHEKLGSLEGTIGADNVKVVKELYAELEKIGKSGKKPEEMAKEAKKLVEEKLGTLEELKSKAAGAAGQAKDAAKDVAGGGSDKLAKYAAAIPGLGGLGKILGGEELETLKNLAEKHGAEAEKLLESTYDEIKSVLKKKVEEAKKVGSDAAGDAKKQSNK
ncbi:hypothetical protein RQP46_001549 [Phenoliferia psychrophenolica]